MTDQERARTERTALTGVVTCALGLVRDNQRTLVMVTHNTDVAARCDRILKLQDGSLTAA